MNCVRRSQPNNNKGEEEASRWIHMILIIGHDFQLEERLISARLDVRRCRLLPPRPNNDQGPMTHPHEDFQFSFGSAISLREDSTNRSHGSKRISDLFSSNNNRIIKLKAMSIRKLRKFTEAKVSHSTLLSSRGRLSHR